MLVSELALLKPFWYISRMKLRTYLADERMSQKAFGIAVGVSQAAVARYVSEKRFPKPRILNAIARVTSGSVNADDFLTHHSTHTTIGCGETASL